MKKIKKNLLSNISRLTPQTKIVGGLIGLGLSLGALTLNSLSSQTTIKTFNQESSITPFKSNLSVYRGTGLRFFIPIVPAVFLPPVVGWAFLGGIGVGAGIIIGDTIGRKSSAAEYEKKIKETKEENRNLTKRVQILETTNAENQKLLNEIDDEISDY